MATPCLQEEEMLAEKVQGFTGLYDKWFKGFKEKYAVPNAWEKVGESLDFEENGNLLEQVATENILKIAVLKKLMPCSKFLQKTLANQFDFCRCYFGFW